MNYRTLLAVCLILLTGASPLLGQGAVDVSKTGTTAASFLEIQVGAPGVALGGAVVSRTHDASAMYWNAAGIASIEKSDVLLSHTNWIADTKFDYAAFVMPLEGVGSLGISITSLSMSDMLVRTVEQPEGTGEYFSAGDLAASVGFARQLTDRFAIGISGKYIRESIWHESASAMAIDLGTTFRTDLLGGLVIGATLKNFGTSMKMDGRDTRQFHPIDPSKQGSNDRIPEDIELDAWDLPLSFQFGVSTDVMKAEHFHWNIAADAVHPNNNYESLNVGTEFNYQDFLFFRAGYHSLFLNNAEGGLSLGVGVSTPISITSLRFDYAFRDFGRLQSIHVFSVGMQF